MKRHPLPDVSRLEILLPAALRRKLDRHLYDPQRRRVPYGLYSEFFRRLVERELNHQKQLGK
jgi:hypothetical protein